MKASYSEKQEYETETDGIEMELNMSEPLEGKVFIPAWCTRLLGC